MFDMSHYRKNMNKNKSFLFLLCLYAIVPNENKKKRISEFNCFVVAKGLFVEQLSF